MTSNQTACQKVNILRKLKIHTPHFGFFFFFLTLFLWPISWDFIETVDDSVPCAVLSTVMITTQRTRRKRSVRIYLLWPATWRRKPRRTITCSTWLGCWWTVGFTATRDSNPWPTVRDAALTHVLNKFHCNIPESIFLCLCSPFGSARFVHVHNGVVLACECQPTSGAKGRLRRRHHPTQRAKNALQDWDYLHFTNHTASVGCRCESAFDGKIIPTLLPKLALNVLGLSFLSP